MAQALGVKLAGPGGSDIGRGPGALMSLERIDLSERDPRIAETQIWAASDVTNPLCGPEGAAAIYGPQKGATEQMVPMIDKALAHLAVAIERDLGMDIRDLAGAGAAGGLGAGLVAFAGAEIRAGPSLVLQLLNFEEFAQSADLILTGEGKIDRQLEFGKALSGLALLAEKHGVPLVAFTGWLDEEEDKLRERGLDTVVPIATGPLAEQESVERASELLQAAAERAMRLLKLGRRVGDGRWLTP